MKAILQTTRDKLVVYGELEPIAHPWTYGLAMGNTRSHDNSYGKVHYNAGGYANLPLNWFIA